MVFQNIINKKIIYSLRLYHETLLGKIIDFPLCGTLLEFPGSCALSRFKVISARQHPATPAIRDRKRLSSRKSERILWV